MALISDLLANGPTYSFEFFPPKNDQEQATLVKTLRDLELLSPSFVSVTYRGGAESRQRTHDLVAGLVKTTTLLPMAHLICVVHTRLELAEILVKFRRAGVMNLMALGGDPPSDPDAFKGDLNHAIELVELARSVGGYSIGVAAHPAGHPDSPDLVTDRHHLAEKLRVADFAITQFFFEADQYFSLVNDLADRDVTKPVLPGIMPVTTLSAVPRMTAMGAPVPTWQVERLHAAESSGGADAVRRCGIELAIDLCRKLIEGGVPGLHFYTLNKSSATREIYAALELPKA